MVLTLWDVTRRKARPCRRRKTKRAKKKRQPDGKVESDSGAMGKDSGRWKKVRLNPRRKTPFSHRPFALSHSPKTESDPTFPQARRRFTSLKTEGEEKAKPDILTCQEHPQKQIGDVKLLV